MTERTTAPPERILLKCGHASNAVDGDEKPTCAICAGIRPGADETAPAPDLSGRHARCAYYGQVRNAHCDYGGTNQPDRVCRCEAESSLDLPFFELRMGQPFDRFYCGCAGWD